jgi:hypothetical protein
MTAAWTTAATRSGVGKRPGKRPPIAYEPQGAPRARASWKPIAPAATAAKASAERGTMLMVDAPWRAQGLRAQGLRAQESRPPQVAATARVAPIMPRRREGGARSTLSPRR